MHHYDPAAVAARMVTKYNFTSPPVNTGIVLLDFPVRVLLQDWPNEIAGAFARGVTVSHIGLNTHHPRERRHFTLWHEFYHFIAHKGIRYVEYSKPLATQIEREADVFAANVLMPDDWVRELWEKYNGYIGPMAHACLVSRSAMAWRVRELGLRRD